jgi:3',5'-cyclic-AMP phosphodiesterase
MIHLMKRFAWLTDLHLNFVPKEARGPLHEALRQAGADALLIGGDTAEAHDFSYELRTLAETCGVPIYFVLGNHDYYRGTIAGVRRQAAMLAEHQPAVIWLPAAGVVQLTEKTALVGHGGWGDGRFGDFFGSDVILNDYLLIEDLKELLPGDWPPTWFSERDILSPRLHEKLMALGDEAAAHLRRVLPEACEKFQNVIALTHVPPFQEACLHKGKVSDKNWLPHFTCQATGEAVREAAEKFPKCKITVLCGHTHSGGQAQIRENLVVLTGSATYGEPAVQKVLEVE